MRIRPSVLVLASLLPLLLSACSVRQMAMRSVTSALTGGVSVFATDPDDQLVGDALPFALKTVEALLESDPENVDLLLTACSGFTQYSYAFVELGAHRLTPVDYRAGAAERARARDLYLRARGYCFRAVDVLRPGASKRLPLDPVPALGDLPDTHTDLVYWTAASWGAAISTGLERPEIVIDLPSVRAIFEHLLELDEGYNKGALHDAMVSLEAVPAAMGGSVERAAVHYERAVTLSGDSRVGTHLNWAWLVEMRRQNRKGFEAAVDKALAVDMNESPADRVANTVNRKFALFLRDRADDVFLDDLEDDLEDMEGR